MPRPADNQAEADLLWTIMTTHWPEIEERPRRDGKMVVTCPRFRKGQSRGRPSERTRYWGHADNRALKACMAFKYPEGFIIIGVRPGGTVRPNLPPAHRAAMNRWRDRGNNGSDRLTRG